MIENQLVEVQIEGIDKTGKTSLVYYLRHLSKFQLIVSDRGIITSIALRKIQGLDSFASEELMKSKNIVYLTANNDDWQLRCRMTNENFIPYDIFQKEWNIAKDILKKNNANVLEYNTSEMTIYQIANDIIRKLLKECDK